MYMLVIYIRTALLICQCTMVPVQCLSLAYAPPLPSPKLCCDCLDGGRYIVTGQSGSQAAAVVSADCEIVRKCAMRLGWMCLRRKRGSAVSMGKGGFVVNRQSDVITVLHTMRKYELRVYVCILHMDDDSNSLLYVYVALLRCGM